MRIAAVRLQQQRIAEIVKGRAIFPGRQRAIDGPGKRVEAHYAPSFRTPTRAPPNFDDPTVGRRRAALAGEFLRTLYDNTRRRKGLPIWKQFDQRRTIVAARCQCDVSHSRNARFTKESLKRGGLSVEPVLRKSIHLILSVVY